MTLLAVERIKLFSTRSPWFSMLGALGVTVGLVGLIAATASEPPADMGDTQLGRMFGLMVIMVMAALAVTTEYRFGTIRTTFQAVPNRTSVVLAKTAVVAVLAGVIGELAAFGSWGAARLFKPAADLAIDTPAEWRMVAGAGLVYAIGAVMAVAVGVLVRQSAGAVSILMIWPLLVETLVSLIPKVGEKIRWRMPFTNAMEFLAGPTEGAAFSPWAALAYFAGIAAVLLAAALVVTNKRDA